MRDAVRAVHCTLPVSEVSYERFPFGGKVFDVITPELQHLSPLLRVFGPVVNASHSFHLVIKCLLNDVRRKTLFVQLRRTRPPEIVNRKRRHFEGDTP